MRNMSGIFFIGLVGFLVSFVIMFIGEEVKSILSMLFMMLLGMVVVF